MSGKDDFVIDRIKTFPDDLISKPPSITFPIPDVFERMKSETDKGFKERLGFGLAPKEIPCDFPDFLKDLQEL